MSIGFLLSAILILSLSAVSCQKTPKAVFYIENSSSDMPKIDLQIYLDDSLVIADMFEVDSVVPHFTIRSFPIKKGSHQITVKCESQKISKTEQM